MKGIIPLFVIVPPSNLNKRDSLGKEKRGNCKKNLFPLKQLKVSSYPFDK